jgi:hypothetical protein
MKPYHFSPAMKDEVE